jgi:hypothetical protein
MFKKIYIYWLTQDLYSVDGIMLRMDFDVV